MREVLVLVQGQVVAVVRLVVMGLLVVVAAGVLAEAETVETVVTVVSKKK